MTNLAKLASAIACVALSAPVLAQERDIVVEGEAAEDPEVVRALVQRLADSHRSDTPATRYFDAMCLSVSGLNTAGNDYVRERIYENALEIGLGNQGDDCRANALVLVHADPAALVDRIMEDVPHLLPREIRGGVREQLADGSPIIVWHNEADYNAGGRPGNRRGAIPGDDNVGGSLNVEAQININNWPSRAELAFSRAVVSAVVIFDAAIIEGMEIDRMADYAMMRLMAPDLIPLEGEEPEPASVTAPFPEEGGVSTLTRFDRAYLSALYAMRPNAPAPRLAQLVAEAYEGEE